MSEELKANVRRNADEIWNKGNLDRLDDTYAADFVRHSPPFQSVEGLEALKQFVADTRKTYPDFHITVDELIVEADTMVSRWTWRGTHTGQSAFLPLPPTGKQVIGKGCTVSHIKDGKVVEEWFYADNLGILQQLGVIPPLEISGA